MLVLVGGAIAVAAFTVGIVGWWVRRARRSLLPRDLDRMLRGRQAIADALTRSGPLGFEALRTRLTPRPGPGALADWLVAMLTDGTLTAVSVEGRAAFAMSRPPAPRSTARVTLDEGTLARALDRYERGDPAGESAPAGGAR